MKYEILKSVVSITLAILVMNVVLALSGYRVEVVKIHPPDPKTEIQVMESRIDDMETMLQSADEETASAERQRDAAYNRIEELSQKPNQ